MARRPKCLTTGLKRAGLNPLDRRQFMELCAGSLAAVAVGCGRTREHDRRSTLTILYPGDEWILGPAEDMQAKLLMFLPLAGRNAKGELEGRLAESWDHSADYRTWTVRLRRDIRWHDEIGRAHV